MRVVRRPLCAAAVFAWLSACGEGPPREGPAYSLHCGGEVNAPVCVRFHLQSGAARRVDIARVPPAATATGGGPYELRCRRWTLPHGDPRAGAQVQRYLCLRLDVTTGDLASLDPASLPAAL